MIDRKFWTSEYGEPFAVMELALLRAILAILAALAAALCSHSGVVVIAVMTVAYLIADRMVIVGEWVCEVRRQRRADARMIAALNRAANAAPRDRMAVRM